MIFDAAFVAPKPLRFCSHSDDAHHCASKSCEQQQRQEPQGQDSELREILLSPCLPAHELFQHEALSAEFPVQLGASPLPERVCNPMAAHLEGAGVRRGPCGGPAKSLKTPEELGAQLGLLSLSPAPALY
eukprot:m51a1_g5846 hypothetical protein (130) ;mRNA; f:320729-321334